MKIAFGMKSHSGWAALVAVGKTGRGFAVVDRRRIELVEEAWAKQPYHAAQRAEPAYAREVVTRGIDAARRIAAREMRVSVKRERARGNDVTACAVLVGNSMPDWSVEEILAVHFRMHKAEGVLFQDVLMRAAKACGLRPIAIPEKPLATRAARLLARLDPVVGPPWAKDQQDAAAAALAALEDG